MMVKRSFALLPFPAPGIPEVALTGEVTRNRDVLSVHYVLSGDLEEVCLPPPCAQPSRKDELWQSTCFEFFLAVGGRPDYWEFNLSPCGDWNVYRMDAYRRVGFREEAAVQRLPITVEREADQYTLEVSADLTSLLPGHPSVEAGVTAVIQTRDRERTYWALTHPAAEADFHRRDSFILALAGSAPPSP